MNNNEAIPTLSELFDSVIGRLFADARKSEQNAAEICDVAVTPTLLTPIGQRLIRLSGAIHAIPFAVATDTKQLLIAVANREIEWLDRHFSNEDLRKTADRGNSDEFVMSWKEIDEALLTIYTTWLVVSSE